MSDRTQNITPHADAIRAAMLDAEVALIELMRNRLAMRSLPTVGSDAGSLRIIRSDDEAA